MYEKRLESFRTIILELSLFFTRANKAPLTTPFVGFLQLPKSYFKYNFKKQPNYHFTIFKPPHRSQELHLPPKRNLCPKTTRSVGIPRNPVESLGKRKLNWHKFPPDPVPRILRRQREREINNRSFRDSDRTDPSRQTMLCQAQLALSLSLCLGVLNRVCSWLWLYKIFYISGNGFEETKRTRQLRAYRLTTPPTLSVSLSE